jgi:GxxExxY protein
MENRNRSHKKFDPIPIRTDEINKPILDVAYKVYTPLGPDFFESVDKTCLIDELKSLGSNVETQGSFPVVFKGITNSSDLRIDLLDEKCATVGIMTVENIISSYTAQLPTSMKLTNINEGLLRNFNIIH